MAKIQKDAAMFDLFDNGDNSQPGERQTDIEDIIFEKSLLGMIQADLKRLIHDLADGLRR